MNSIADLLEEQVKRREYHRKFNDDNARRVHGLEVMEPDPPKVTVVKHVNVVEDKKECQSTENDKTTESEITQVQTAQPQSISSLQQDSQPEPSEGLKKWLPAALAGVIGASAVGIPLYLNQKGGDPKDEKPIEDVVDIDAHSTTINTSPDKKSIFTVIQDEMKHLEGE